MHPVETIQLPDYLETDLDDVPPAYAKLGGAEPDLDTTTMDWIKERGTRKWQEAVQGYLASVSFADAMVGRLIDALDASGRAEDTIIVLWADHGFHLGQKDTWGKMTLWDESTNVPLVIVAPGVTTPGSRSDEAVSTHSIYPTLVELAGLERPDFVDGTSLVPLLRDPTRTWDDVAITTYGDYGNFTVRDDRYRYIVYADGEEELYDTETDPNQWTNLAGDPRYDAIKQELAARIPPADSHAPEVVGVAK
jgi:arylsulfatase A-like enzyme